jgi:hypothetical protein
MKLFGKEVQLFSQGPPEPGGTPIQGCRSISGCSREWIRSSDHIFSVIKCIITLIKWDVVVIALV